jgi:hypothetical protein
MTADQYKAERQRRGTQQGVAALLGVDYRTIQRRESGDIEITREAALAIRALPVGRAAAAGRSAEKKRRSIKSLPPPSERRGCGAAAPARVGRTPRKPENTAPRFPQVTIQEPSNRGHNWK